MELADIYDFRDEEWDSMEEARQEFEWRLPDTFNPGRFLVDRWAEESGERTALQYRDETAGVSGTSTYAKIRDQTNQLANYFEEAGLEAGDRVALNVPNKREILLSYVAAWKLGAIPVPLSTLYGPDALEYRLTDSGAVLAVVDECNVDNFRAASSPDVRQVLTVGDVDREDDEEPFWDCIGRGSTDFEWVDIGIEEPVLLPYTSGTTGDPKGVLIANRGIIAQMPGMQLHVFNNDHRDGDVLWGPGEFTWSGVISLLVGAWWNGIGLGIVETGESFDPETAYRTIEEFGVTHAFLPATALRMMRKVNDPTERYDLSSFRLIGSGGESLGVETANWVREAFDVTIHEGYAQTELWNLVIGDCTALEEFMPGYMGSTLPGHDPTVVDPTTREPVPEGEVGELAFDRDDPVVLLEYWNDPERTAQKFHRDLVLTEDLVVEEDGQFRFVSRADDVIISSGYRIGPDEVEDSLADHSKVVDAGVIGIPDDERGSVVKAFVSLGDGVAETESVREDLQSYVRDNLAAYEYPREIEIVEDLPRTTTGKVRRSDLREWEGVSK
jgi:acetyl-CoA synthetase